MLARILEDGAANHEIEHQYTVARFLVPLPPPGCLVAGAEIGRHLARSGVEAGPARWLAAHDIAGMWARDRIGRLGKESAED